MTLLHKIITNRNQTQLHAGGAIAAATLLAVLVVIAVPAWSQRTHRLELHAAVDSAEARLQRSRAQLDQTHRDIHVLSTKLAALSVNVANARTIDHRLLDISSLANDLGLQIDSVEPGTAVKRPDGDVVTAIVASGHGAYPRAIAFIQRMRAEAPDLTVETAQLTATADRGCAFRLSLNWFSAPAAVQRPMSVAGGSQ